MLDTIEDEMLDEVGVEEILEAIEDAGLDELTGAMLDTAVDDEEEEELLESSSDPPPQATRPNNMQGRSVCFSMAFTLH
jgi:hypothetical protein